jgi:hypothetical protein
VGKIILSNGRLKRFEVTNTKVYRVNVTAVAVAKWRAEFAIVTVVAIKINY